MKTLNATQAKNQFGQLLDDAQAGPVAIQKNGRDVAVLISMAQYKAIASEESIHDLVDKYHEESIERYGELYTELAK